MNIVSNWLIESTKKIESLLLVGEESWSVGGIILDDFSKCQFHKVEYTNLQELKPDKIYDIAIALRVKAANSKSKNKEILEKLLSHANLIIFSSDVPCSLNRNENRYWPSYWITLLDDLQFIWSIELKAKLWYSEVIQPEILEGLLTYRKSDR
jgi:hypothetical protein